LYINDHHTNPNLLPDNRKEESCGGRLIIERVKPSLHPKKTWKFSERNVLNPGLAILGNSLLGEQKNSQKCPDP
jgi:hypothetical protein